MPKLLLERLAVLDAYLMLMALVQPNSLLSNANTSWQARTSSLTTAAFSGDQWANLSKFNFSSSFSCLTATDMGLGQDSVPRAASISGDNSTGGTSDADTTHTMGTPILRKMWLSEMFLTTRDTLLLPFLRRVYT